MIQPTAYRIAPMGNPSGVFAVTVSFCATPTAC